MKRFPWTELQLVSLLQDFSLSRYFLFLTTFPREQIHWAIKTGLGPGLFHVFQSYPEPPQFGVEPLL